MGDAGGQPGDHSDSDRVFAKACGLQFYRPEVAFREAGPPWEPFQLPAGGQAHQGDGETGDLPEAREAGLECAAALASCSKEKGEVIVLD